MKRVRLALLVACIAVLTACTSQSGGGSSSTTSSTPTSTAAISTDPVAASKEAEIKKAEEVRVSQRINEITAAADAAGSLDEKLGVLVTEYCRLSGPEKERFTDEQFGPDWDIVQELQMIYRRYWRAGGKWNTPLDEAAKQQGACPLPPTTVATPYPKR